MVSLAVRALVKQLLMNGAGHCLLLFSLAGCLLVVICVFVVVFSLMIVVCFHLSQMIVG